MMKPFGIYFSEIRNIDFKKGLFRYALEIDHFSNNVNGPITIFIRKYSPFYRGIKSYFD